MVMIAWTIYRQGLCPECGYPTSICRNFESFDAKVEVCQARKVVDEARSEMSKSKDPHHGAVVYPQYHSPEESAVKIPEGFS